MKRAQAQLRVAQPQAFAISLANLHCAMDATLQLAAPAHAQTAMRPPGDRMARRRRKALQVRRDESKNFRLTARINERMKKQKPDPRDILIGGARLQAAALPFRRVKELEVLLISTLDTGRWIVPKGWPMKGRANFETAKREAFEEAGVKGEISAEPAGSFHYNKRRRNGAVWKCLVEVFPLEVKAQSRTWPEKSARKTRWCNWSEAADLVDDEELGDIIRAFAAKEAGAKTAA